MTYAKAKIVFSSHMEASRRRKLTAYEREQLARAAAVLRRSRRASMNPKQGRSDGQLRARLRIIRARAGSRYQSTAAILLRYAFWSDVERAEARRIIEAAKKEARGNPPKYTSKSGSKRVAKIYGRVLRIEAQKVGPHNCDAECRKCKHRYFHDFRVGPEMIGLSPGQVFKVPAGCWPLVIMC